ncbi:hypothetical protein Tco_1305008, partial [Tanacetum coccineum]
GKVVSQWPRDPQDEIKKLFGDKGFQENIRAYNQMFAITSFGAHIDYSVNKRRGPYVFKISGQIYHWIGLLCPTPGNPPRFLQLYIYDTDNEVASRMRHFPEGGSSQLDPGIVSSLIRVLDEHNELVRLFRTARDRISANVILEFWIRLFKVVGVCEYDLPTSGTRGEIVFESGPNTRTDYDVIIESRDGCPQRVNKLHLLDMALQFPLLFVYGESGFHPEMKQCCGTDKRMSMNLYYMFQLHERLDSNGLLFRDGWLFQQYVVGVYCCIEQNRLDFYRLCQNDIRREYLSGVYDAICRGDQEELPDPEFDPQGYRVISEMMVHGPCGPFDSKAVCMKEGKSCWRILKYKIHSRQPAVQILSVHLEIMQSVTFRDRQLLTLIVNDEGKTNTTLTGWLEYNKFNQDGRHLAYIDFPKEFVWYPDSKSWRRRKKKTTCSISRLANVHPTSGELFYLRMLLYHQTGCTSFEDIRTVNKRLYPTFRSACEALGLLGDDKEWHTALEEAAFSATSQQLRSLFAQILIFCDVADPLKLWKSYWRRILDDIPRTVSDSLHIKDLYMNDPELEGGVLCELE